MVGHTGKGRLSRQLSKGFGGRLEESQDFVEEGEAKEMGLGVGQEGSDWRSRNPLDYLVGSGVRVGGVEGISGWRRRMMMGVDFNFCSRSTFGSLILLRDVLRLTIVHSVFLKSV